MDNGNTAALRDDSSDCHARERARGVVKWRARELRGGKRSEADTRGHSHFTLQLE